MYGWPSFSAYIKNQWQRHQKEFLMVEVAHPFVVGDFDGKGNLAPFVQPGFPPTPTGQRRYMETICEDVADGGGLGVIYWGGEWVGNDMYVYHDFKNSTWEDKAFWTSERNSKIHELHEGIDWMKRDYDGVFKVHLFALADEMQEMHGKAAEGAAEGQYQTGAKAAFQEVIDRGMALYNDAGSTQDWVDVTHKLMLDAITAFEDRMNPFVSEMTALITSSKALLNQTNVGAGAGMIPAQTDKNELSAAITQAEQFMQSTANITQRLLAAEAERLEKAVSAFKGKIPGVYEVDVVNPSFEPDITDTNANGNYLFKDFDHIPGWNTAGLIQGLAPWDEGQYNCLVLKGGSQLTNFSNVDGDHVMQLHEFNLPIWQQLQERVKSNTRYTVTVNAGMWDSQPQDHNYVRVQLVVFNGKVGDLENITVLKEQQFTNISYAGLQELKMEYDTPATPEHLGKRMALTFCGYYWSVKKTTFNVNWNGPNNQTYFIDLVKMTREKK
jgi:hypothetical protein